MDLLGIASEIGDRARARLQRRLERRDPPGSALTLAATAWAAIAAARVARPLILPAGTRVIGVGGATLGGGGKTPLAVALAAALSSRHRVALIGHGYRARPGAARAVGCDDAVEAVGDDALAAARLLSPFDVPVVVAPSRQGALDHAASLGARVLVVDGLLQAAPVRLDHAVLALDATCPWGSEACPPAGDLRAPREVGSPGTELEFAL